MVFFDLTSFYSLGQYYSFCKASLNRYIRKCFYFSFLDSKLNEKRPDAVQKMISTSILYSIHCCTVLRITSFPSSGFTPVVTVNTLGRNLVNPTSEALCCSLGLLQHNKAALARAKACLVAVGTSSFKGLPYISLASSLKNWTRTILLC